MREFTLSAPIVKVDEEQGIIYAYATSEDLDKQGEIVDHEASKKAFSSWISTLGNIREMHQPKAVGKAFDAQFEDDNHRTLLGLKLSQSRDGRDALTKVKEGIYTGLSIGGKVKQMIQEALKSDDGTDQTVNRITDYELTEVSLVDNPANPAAQIVMVKSVDGVPQATAALDTIPVGSTAPWWMKFYTITDGQISNLKKDHNMKDEVTKAADAEEKVDGTGTPPVSNDQSEDLSKAKGKSSSETSDPSNDVDGAGDTDQDEQSGTGVVSEADETQDLSATGPVTPEENGDAQKPKNQTVEQNETQVINAKEIADQPTDLVKAIATAVGGEIAKLSTQASSQSDELTKAIGKLDEAVGTISSLEDRISKLESLPLVPKVKASFMDVEKVASETDEVSTLRAHIEELDRKADEFGKSVSAASPEERVGLLEDLRKSKHRLAALTNQTN